MNFTIIVTIQIARPEKTKFSAIPKKIAELLRILQKYLFYYKLIINLLQGLLKN